MINLLPEKNKDALLMERNKRVVLIFCFLILFFIVLLVLIFSEIKFYLDKQISANQVLLVESKEKFSQSEVQEIQDKIELANSSFSKLNIFYNREVYFSDILEKISNILPERFSLDNLSIKLDVKENKIQKDDGTKEIEVERKVIATISGFAPLREDLRAFKDKLETEVTFKNIFFPSSNWVNKENINFYLVFEISI
ncbi:hypothetical protein KKA24_00390 [Patescibacteria group bacterium]|nr:hypothetical protein [Patescibacteria group bacterium]